MIRRPGVGTGVAISSTEQKHWYLRGGGGREGQKKGGGDKKQKEVGE